MFSYRHPGPRRVWKVETEPQALTPDPGDPLDLLDPGDPLDLLDPLLGSLWFILIVFCGAW